MSKNIVIFVAATLFLSSPYLANAQQAIFLVRHGETVAPKGADARPLSEAGHRRAALLATLLKDAGIKAIFTSNLERTIKTAEPLAQALRIESKPLVQLNVQFKQSDVDAFVNFLRTEHRADIVLLVGHRETVPALLKALGHPVEIKILETEFDNLFVLTPKAEGPPTFLRLRYQPEYYARLSLRGWSGREEVLARIRVGFDAERENPSDVPETLKQR